MNEHPDDDGPADLAAASARPGSTPRPPSMSDVAMHAGVSHQTVSRVLNDHPSVAPSTRERVVEAIAALGYRPNRAARSLVTRRTDTLGVVTPTGALYGPTSTLIGFEEAARDAGFVVSVATVRRFDGPTMRAALEHFLLQGVDAFAIIAPTVAAVEVLASVELPVPVVLLSSASAVPDVPHLHAVAVDQQHGARLATRHLIAQGHRTVLHVAGPQDWFDARDRVAGWRGECVAAGLVAPDPVVVGWDASDGYELGRRLVRDGLPPAVFCANDQLALGLLHAFWEAGVRVPDDVAVVGFDDEVGSAHYTPPLTTVRQDFAGLGRLAIGSLTAALAGEVPGRRLLPAELVVRRSSVRA
ncbi:LacI family transcriptional regulator [Cellulomonas soli]|uniref:LacI family transcriptional regulator n=2 Tax=Cellulomonas soli TaxID=931535 RepID=A0A512PGB5_9CELL|nr:LacI family DNA-binding transcriptional regulator [Cellulomonas soli]NYI58101.1 DNA-binding LacI/PurR family transcriptional regulator [Cellulomonas soli]GEP70236.1 LacI family transcriptional regulator [Cellulomonas soli]